MWRDLQINLESTINLVRDQLGSVRNHDLGTKTSCKPLTQEFKSKGHNELSTVLYITYIIQLINHPKCWGHGPSLESALGVDFGGGLGMGNKFTDITTRFPAIISKCIWFERIHMKPWANKTNFGSSYVTRITSLGGPQTEAGCFATEEPWVLSSVWHRKLQASFWLHQVQAKWPISIKSLFKLQFDFSVAIRCSIMVYCWRVTVTLRYTTRILLLLLHATTHGSRWFMSVHEFMKVIQHHFNSKCLSIASAVTRHPSPKPWEASLMSFPVPNYPTWMFNKEKHSVAWGSKSQKKVSRFQAAELQRSERIHGPGKSPWYLQQGVWHAGILMDWKYDDLSIIWMYLDN